MNNKNDNMNKMIYNYIYKIQNTCKFDNNSNCYRMDKNKNTI